MVGAVPLVCISSISNYIDTYIDFHHEERRSQRSSFSEPGFYKSSAKKKSSSWQAELGFSVSVFFSIRGWETQIPEDPCTFIQSLKIFWANDVSGKSPRLLDTFSIPQYFSLEKIARTARMFQHLEKRGLKGHGKFSWVRLECCLAEKKRIPSGISERFLFGTFFFLNMLFDFQTYIYIYKYDYLFLLVSSK